jgi:hypothetical protein
MVYELMLRKLLKYSTQHRSLCSLVGEEDFSGRNCFLRLCLKKQLRPIKVLFLGRF